MGGEWGQREDMVETEPIRINLQQKAFLDSIGAKKDSYADIVERLIEAYKTLYTKMNESLVDEWGKVMISRTVKGKTIIWKLKE